MKKPKAVANAYAYLYKHLAALEDQPQRELMTDDLASRMALRYATLKAAGETLSPDLTSRLRAVGAIRC